MPVTQCTHVYCTLEPKRFMGPTWGPPGSCRPQVGPMFAPWTLLSGKGCLLGEVTGQKDKHADRQDFIVVDWTGWRAHGTLRLDADKHEMSPANQDTDRMWQVSKLQWLFFICWSLFDKIIKKIDQRIMYYRNSTTGSEIFFPFFMVEHIIISCPYYCETYCNNE